MVIRQAVRLISDMLESVTDDAYFEARQIVSEISGGKMPVSYTHLEVYKRQWQCCALLLCSAAFLRAFSPEIC